MNILQTALIKPQKDLLYTYNFNKKLQCRFHITIVPADEYYKAGEYYRVLLNGDYLYKARIVDIRQTILQQIPPFLAALETGYNLEQTIAILHKRFPGIIWEMQTLYILLIENIEWEYPHEEFSFPLNDVA
jgi:hypothetical protein